MLDHIQSPRPVPRTRIGGRFRAIVPQPTPSRVWRLVAAALLLAVACLLLLYL